MRPIPDVRWVKEAVVQLVWRKMVCVPFFKGSSLSESGPQMKISHEKSFTVPKCSLVDVPMNVPILTSSIRVL